MIVGSPETAGTAAVVGRFITDQPRRQPYCVRAEFSALRRRRGLQQQFVAEVAPLLKERRLRYEETVVEGIRN